MDIVQLTKQYKKEKKKWKEAGKPLRNPERIAEIYSICSGCPHFEKDGGFVPGYDKCGICQCNLHPSSDHLNKIAWATTKCPAETPLWLPDASQDDVK